MEIDLGQLPIPDWDVHCPGCGYALRGLTLHRCPECGRAFEMSEVVRTWTRVREPRFSGMERPLPDFGLACKKCSAALAGVSHDWCEKCGEPFDPSAMQPTKAWFLVDEAFAGTLDLTTLAAVLEQEQVPFVPVSGRTSNDLFLGTRAIGARLLAPSEFYFEVLWIARDRKNRMQAIQGAVQTEWACSTCQEMNPGHFEICWRCETARSGP